MRGARLLVALAGLALAVGLFSTLLVYCTPPAPVAVVLPPPDPGETPEQIAERKRLFIALLLPIIQAENRRLLVDRARINRIEYELSSQDDISRDDFDWVKQMASDYDLDPKARRNAEFFNSMRRRVDMLPAAMIIAQAALESGWGRADISREANNFFGHYCFGKDCGEPAPGAGDLRRFATPADSVRAYMHNLNSHPAYAELRRQRAIIRSAGKMATGSELAATLGRYSERGTAYVDDVTSLIVSNDLETLSDR